MKNTEKRIVWILFLIASVRYLIGAYYNYISNNDMLLMNIGLGICFLCVAIHFAIQDFKCRKNKDKNKDLNDKELSSDR